MVVHPISICTLIVAVDARSLAAQQRDSQITGLEQRHWLCSHQVNSRNDIEVGEQKEEEILQVPPPHVVVSGSAVDLWRSGLLDAGCWQRQVRLFEPPKP